jgi:hypothetical protein
MKAIQQWPAQIASGYDVSNGKRLDLLTNWRALYCSTEWYNRSTPGSGLEQHHDIVDGANLTGPLCKPSKVALLSAVASHAFDVQMAGWGPVEGGMSAWRVQTRKTASLGWHDGVSVQRS